MLRCLFFLAFLSAVAILSPRSAWASCGDWLAHQEPLEVVAPAGPADGTFVDRLQVEFNGPEQPIAPQGCHGPLCKQSPMGAIPDPILPVSERQHYETAFLTAFDHRTAPFNWDVVEDARLLLSSGIEYRIDRPPQA
ncbi:hypothetical protein [Neorhodopirellula pilleata]|uniref:Uncharacterized protein n=1 Tax=Neorhodopirellula pilleata TaxID=2714738 RepID=A0A5C6A8A1_9BACT|nr:hypothetical protein [Neorhodopirellula pilleata]TWT95676.1 hypothetical protein Pla100_33170 [Neorhodopirellula pilleata]